MSHFCGWNLSLGCSAILTTNKKKCHRQYQSTAFVRWCSKRRLPSHTLAGTVSNPGDAHPPPSPTPPATLFKCCGHRYVKRSVVGVAYPLSGELLLIGRSSADCVSSVRILLSHPPEAFVSPVRACPSVYRPPTYWAQRNEDAETHTWTFLHEKSDLSAKRCPTKLE